MIKENRISLIKLDIEGAEEYFFNSINNLLEEDKIKNLIIEISPKYNLSYVNISKKLYGYGYKIYDIGLSPQRQLEQNTCHLKNIDTLKVNIENIDDYIKNIEHGQTNFLFRK